MTTFRLLKAHELPNAAQLSNSVFRPNMKPTMADMFPRLFAPGIVQSYGAFTEEGTLAAFMGLAPSTLRIGGAASLRAFSMGSVFTAPEHRGAGLAGELLNLCIAHTQKAEAPLLFISGERSLYTRAGSTYFGRATKAILRRSIHDLSAATDSSVPAQPSIRLRLAEPQDLLRLHHLHESNHTRFEESAAGIGELLGASAYCNVLGLAQLTIVAENEQGLASYAVLGVPHHVQSALRNGSAPSLNVESEKSNPATFISYGGKAQDTANLIHALPDFCRLDELHVDIPWQDQDLETLLEQKGAELQSIRNGGTLLVTDIRLLLEQAYDLWPLPWEEALRVDPDGRVFAATSNRELSRAEWYGTLFDPHYPRPGDIPIWFDPIPLPNPYGLHYI
ncbi:GNAT family N-acetyltransferase [Saccharibacillus sacchari]|uniref:GNAT family N-acetyltransferase n=1 Tax=Saccharibacillus sacchari TaxID=456493 RepID=UPI0004B3D216|nr:GNAT family N-acetyltransferase [Saccharibacillus sacchari]